MARPFSQRECDRVKYLREDGVSLAEIAPQLGRHPSSIHVLEQRGYDCRAMRVSRGGGRLGRPMPADYAAVRSTLTSKRQVAAHYKCHRAAVDRWDREICFTPVASPVLEVEDRATPTVPWTAEELEIVRAGIAEGRRHEDLVDSLPGRTVRAIQIKARENGWLLKETARLTSARKPRRTRLVSPGSWGPRQGAFNGSSISNGRAALAARHLQRFYVGVYHRGRKNPDERGIWQVETKRMTEAEMITLAKRKGFEPVAYLAVA